MLRSFPRARVGPRRLRASVRLRESLGSEVMVHFQVEAAPAVSEDIRELAEGADEGTLLNVLDHERRLRKTSFVGKVLDRHDVKEGMEHDIAIGPGALRFFDPASGDALNGRQSNHDAAAGVSPRHPEFRTI